MAKLRIQAAKVKAVLSANKDTPIFINSLIGRLEPFQQFLTSLRVLGHLGFALSV